jgi:peptidoglycan/xylan/chitin deacetylase (PgdA/CDA1 family)
VNHPTIVTTSWDDGDPSDLRVADLLIANNLRGTFYVPLHREPGTRMLSSSEVRSLALAGFEIGGHTVSHRTLTNLPPDEIRHEVRECKRSLEQLLGYEVSEFCYPRGRYDARVVREVELAGFEGGRTTRMLSLSSDFPRFAMPTTVQAFPHRNLDYVKNLTRAKDLPELIRYGAHLRHLPTWIDKGRALFDEALRKGGVWHLYGHSWEIQELGLWNELKEMLSYVSNREGVTYATNSEVRMLRERIPSRDPAGCLT